MIVDAKHCRACGKRLRKRKKPTGSPRLSCGTACAWRAARRVRLGQPVSDAEYRTTRSPT